MLACRPHRFAKRGRGDGGSSPRQMRIRTRAGGRRARRPRRACPSGRWSGSSAVSGSSACGRERVTDAGQVSPRPAIRASRHGILDTGGHAERARPTSLPGTRTALHRQRPTGRLSYPVSRFRARSEPRDGAQRHGGSGGPRPAALAAYLRGPHSHRPGVSVLRRQPAQSRAGQPQRARAPAVAARDQG